MDATILPCTKKYGNSQVRSVEGIVETYLEIRTPEAKLISMKLKTNWMLHVYE